MKHNKAQLQELFGIDHVNNGNIYLAWYGQLRAEEYSHEEAMAMTIKHWKIADTDWYKARQARKERNATQ